MKKVHEEKSKREKKRGRSHPVPGREYYELPDRMQFYISETDIWKEGKTVYPVTKRFGEDGPLYDDGEHIVYVNAEIDDGSRIAKMMKYFKTII